MNLPGAAGGQDVVELTRLDILSRLEQVEAGLLKQDPMLPVHLSNIHKSLLQYEELVHILPPEKIGVLMQGLAKYKNVSLVKEVSKSSGRGGKGLKNTTLDDL